MTPNLDFVDAALDPADVMELVRGWQSDAMSFETLYENLQRGGIASVERTAEEELELIRSGSPPPARVRDPVLPPGQGRVPQVEGPSRDAAAGEPGAGR